MKVVACIPVYGRLRVLSRVITRLYQKNGVYKVVCAGDQARDKRLVEKFGGEWVEAPNDPIGNKWNKAFQAAKEHNPDACLYIGSDDFIEDGWVDVMSPYLKDYGIVGVPDFTACDIRDGAYRVAYSGGYRKGSSRYQEPVGGGRLLTAEALDKMKWSPVDPNLNCSLDYSMRRHAETLEIKMTSIPPKTLTVLALSSNHWATKHNYDKIVVAGDGVEYNSKDAMTLLQEKFPEALTLFNDELWERTKK